MSTPQKTVRVPDELWEKAGQVFAARGTDRTKAIVEFLEGEVALASEAHRHPDQDKELVAFLEDQAV